ncbi:MULTISPECIES: hypothetical protein [unclassified Peribacillus]|uniref:hypothetical protein n=1 Tax=unclassified Peribacillus TaxID=2675266 RepID=UPI001912E034|nr:MULTISPECIES: hypothetical protein [unclassified Peribacillus]MBK5502988.1 hypothetical protein [Peribacillus sp. TH14]WMX58885.1 hypothetical protein RE409_30215 [Peribacillus sp. R9-11]
MRYKIRDYHINTNDEATTVREIFESREAVEVAIADLISNTLVDMVMSKCRIFKNDFTFFSHPFIRKNCILRKNDKF